MPTEPPAHQTHRYPRHEKTQKCKKQHSNLSKKIILNGPTLAAQPKQLFNEHGVQIAKTLPTSTNATDSANATSDDANSVPYFGVRRVPRPNPLPV
jgi:hypothetical protein